MSSLLSWVDLTRLCKLQCIFFPSNLSFWEICYVSVALSRILIKLWTLKRNIVFLDRTRKICFIFVLGNPECFLLTVIAYNCYTTICRVLQYPVVRNHKLRVQLRVTGSWISRIPVRIRLTYQIFSLSFCDSNYITTSVTSPQPGLWDTFRN